MISFRRIALASLLASINFSAAAQNYPTGPVRVIVPFPAGGGIDFAARALSPKLTEYTGQSFVVDNRLGASGTIGT